MTGQPPATVLVHPDPLRLEDELSERIRALREGAPTSLILVVAPSTRQVLRLREALAERLGAVLGVECVQYQALAYRFQGTGSPPLTAASDILLETLAHRILRDDPDLPLARYGKDRPAAVRAVLRLITEFREAGILASRLAGVEDLDPQIPRILERFETVLERLEKTSRQSDRSGVLRRACREAAEQKPFLAVFAYGGYELIGSNLDLLRSLPSEHPLTYLVPLDARAPAWEYARRFVTTHLSATPTVLEDRDPVRSTLTAARGFWDHETPPAIFDANSVKLVHVQGPEAELTVAARMALDWIRQGVPPHDIAILSRGLEPYAPLAETVFERHRLAVDTSLSPPGSRYPQVRALLLLLQTLGRDFERQPVIELVRSPWLRRPATVRDENGAWRPGAWDQWSRAYGVVRGASAWMDELPWMLETQPPPPWVRTHPEESERFETRRRDEAASARILGKVIEGWKKDREAWRKCRTGPEHARFLGRLAVKRLRGFRGDSASDLDEAVRSSWLGILDELAGLAAIRSTGDETPDAMTVSEVLEFVERSLESMVLPQRPSSGVRFLDVMQSRGLVFSHVCLIGFHSGLIPRRRREDPFLPDRVRRRLTEQTGKPLPLCSAGRLEERLLFAQTVAATRESLIVVWQSADAEGKAKSASPYLSELCRALPGSPPVRSVLAGETSWTSRVPAHPARAAEWMEKATGMLTREEGSVLIADTAGSASVLELRTAFQGQDPGLVEALDSGLNLVEALESFDGGLDYDGGVGGEEEVPPLSAYSLKRLGRCPLTYFFRHVLKVQPLDETDREFRLGTKELGNQVHALLEGVYSDLHRAGLLNGDAAAETLIENGKQFLQVHFEQLLESMGRRLRDRFPLLFEHTRSTWLRELERFLEKDLHRLAAGGHRLDSLESEWRGETTVDLPEGPETLVLTGVPDRVTRDADEHWLISDYKTGGKLEKEVLPQEFLRSRRVQLPYYILLAQTTGKTGAVSAEALGLGPAFHPDRGFVRADPVTLDPQTFAKLRDGFVETLGVLNAMRRRGSFPFTNDFTCQWCDFRHACRRSHFPSRERVENHPGNRRYFEVQRKSKTKPMLPEASP